MISTPIECPDCHHIFPLEFNGTKLAIQLKGERVTTEDARSEMFYNRDFGKCPKCCVSMPPNFVVGIMADALEETREPAGGNSMEAPTPAGSCCVGGGAESDGRRYDSRDEEQRPCPNGEEI